MKLYSIPITVYATVYVRADNEDDAYSEACKLRDMPIEVTGDALISDLRFDDPDLPDVSISSAMTIADPDPVNIEEIS